MNTTLFLLFPNFGIGHKRYIKRYSQYLKHTFDTLKTKCLRSASCTRLWDRIQLMKGIALRKQSLHGKIAATVLLKLFISGNERPLH